MYSAYEDYTRVQRCYSLVCVPLFHSSYFLFFPQLRFNVERLPTASRGIPRTNLYTVESSPLFVVTNLTHCLVNPVFEANPMFSPRHTNVGLVQSTTKMRLNPQNVIIIISDDSDLFILLEETRLRQTLITKQVNVASPREMRSYNVHRWVGSFISTSSAANENENENEKRSNLTSNYIVSIVVTIAIGGCQWCIILCADSKEAH